MYNHFFSILTSFALFLRVCIWVLEKRLACWDKKAYVMDKFSWNPFKIIFIGSDMIEHIKKKVHLLYKKRKNNVIQLSTLQLVLKDLTLLQNVISE